MRVSLALGLIVVMALVILAAWYYYDRARAKKSEPFYGLAHSVLADRRSGPDRAIDSAFGNEDYIWDEFRSKA